MSWSECALGLEMGDLHGLNVRPFNSLEYHSSMGEGKEGGVAEAFH